MPKNEKIEQLKELIRLTTNSLTKADFTAAFKQVLEAIKRKEDNFSQRFNALAQDLKSAVGELRDIKNFVKSEVSEGVKKVQGLLSSKIDILDKKIGDLEAGKDDMKREMALEAHRMTQEALMPQIPTLEQIENDLPKLGDSIASALELLPKEKKLALEAVKGLREELDEIRALRTRSFGGGGFSQIAMEQHFIDDETPTGTVNGVNTDFVLGHTPSPTGSLKVFVNGQRMRLTTDYTYNATTRTITFLTAPPTGSIILTDYRI